MSAPRHLLVRASAGTGKTFELTSRYLALLLEGADPDRLLATTFTRKAAHEILDRVLRRLAGGARGGKGLDDLRRAIERDVTEQECLAVLARLLRGMDRIRIGTIDSFFVQLARLFALDLGLPPSWRIADEGEADGLRSDAVQDVVAGAARLEVLELLRDLQRQSTGQGAHETLLRFARTGRDALLESAPRAWSRICPLPDVDAGTLDAALAALPALDLPRTKSGKSAGQEKRTWTASKRKLLERTALGDWARVLDIGLAAKVCEGASEFDRSPILPAHLEVLRPIVARALHVATERLALQNRASRTLLERLEVGYRSLARDTGLLRFEDLPDALAPVSGADPLAARGVELDHRLDGRIDHLLLDEFQDTAPVQWRVLRPLAEGILSDDTGARSFFCVGDEKQSIYGWRAAEPRLLRGLAAKRPTLDVKPLHHSYRSSLAVLGAVNQVFGSIASNAAIIADGLDPQVREAAQEFEGTFVAHASAFARGKEPRGAVFMLRAPSPGPGGAKHVPVLDLAVQRVIGMLADAPRASVGILLRHREWIPDLVLRLRDEGIAASDQGGNPLTDSAAVLRALSLLHLADHPGDSIAAFHVAGSVLGTRLRLAPELFRDREAARKRAAEIAREVRVALAALGYGGYLSSIRASAVEGCSDWDVRRFGQLVDLALAWESRAGSRPTSFVEHVRQAKVEDPTAAQVRVMTVHGSKGLQFDAVVLPELDQPALRGERRLLTLRPDPEGAMDIVSHSLSKRIAKAHPELDAVREDVVRRRVTEELCVLYVAMTRAVHRLDLIVQRREKEGSGLTYAAILRGAFDVPADGSAGEVWGHPHRTEPWFREEIAEPRARAPTRTQGPLPRLAPSTRPRALRARTPSSTKSARATRAADVLLPRDAIAARGKLVHRWFEEVEWIETFDRGDEELLAIGRRMESDGDLVAAAFADFRAMLARPRTRAELSRARVGADADVWRERPFAIASPEDGELWTGAFDRVVVLREGGAPVSAEILDFKSDRVAPGGLRERADGYAPQMAAYRRALARILSLPESAIRARLLFLHLDEIVEV